MCYRFIVRGHRGKKTRTTSDFCNSPSDRLETLGLDYYDNSKVPSLLLPKYRVDISLASSSTSDDNLRTRQALPNEDVRDDQ